MINCKNVTQSKFNHGNHDNDEGNEGRSECCLTDTVLEFHVDQKFPSVIETNSSFLFVSSIYLTVFF